MHTNWSEYLPIFVLGFSSLFPLINPIGTAMIIEPYFKGIDNSQRRHYALRIVMYAFFMGAVTVHVGSAVLSFMGVSIPATQTAGGIVIALLGYGLLSRADVDKSDDSEKASLERSVFYPISFPLTLGPGGISTLIALSAHLKHDGPGFFSPKLAVLTAALFTVLLLAYLCFVYNDKISSRMGTTGNQVLNRLMAFLVFCIGIQMAFNGVMGLIKASG